MVSLFEFFYKGYYKTSLGMTLGIYPLLVFVISLVAQLIIKKKAVILVICFLGWFTATLFIFEASFLKWCFIYTFIALLGTLNADVYIVRIKKITAGKF